MPENLELLRKSRGAHRGVAKKFYNEPDGIMNKPFILLNEDVLQQMVELLKKKQAFLSEQNQKIQSPLFDDPANLDDEIFETEEYDDKICQNIDYLHRFVQQKTRHSSRESSFAAGSFTISRNLQNINLRKLDLPSYLDWISFFFTSRKQ